MPSQHTVLHNHFAALHKMIKDAKRKKYGPGDMVRVAKPPPGEAGELWPRVDVPVFLETVHTDGTVTVAWVAAGSTTYTRKRAVARARCGRQCRCRCRRAMRNALLLKLT